MSDEVHASFAVAKDALLGPIVRYAGDRPEARERLRSELDALLEQQGPEALDQLVTRILTTGADFTYYPKDPLACLIHSRVADLAVTRDSGLLDVENLSALSGRPTVFLSNHLSYSDANLLAVLLERAGYADIAGRLTVIAGPKVYSDPLRRFASLCFGTIKTPQSTARSSEEAVMSAREVARLARETIEMADRRLRAGDALLLFVEGTRSRTASMQRALPAVARYLEYPDALLVPLAVTGSEKFVPIGEERLTPTRVTFRVGRPAPGPSLSERCEGNRRLMMDAVGFAIARLLPAEYRGTYSEGGPTDPSMNAASGVADRVFGAA
jgi:1-acyl-sn-glycerol-3-phosphate acyltransferase